MPLRRNRVLRKALATKRRTTKPVVNSVKNTLPKVAKNTKKKHTKNDDDTEYPEDINDDVPKVSELSELSDSSEVAFPSKNSSKTNDIPENIEVKVPKMNDMIRSRYSELLKELWENENQLTDLKLNVTTRNLLNNRSKLWLEYFISTYTFNNYKNLDIFNYMDTFNNSTNYL